MAITRKYVSGLHADNENYFEFTNDGGDANQTFTVYGKVLFLVANHVDGSGPYGAGGVQYSESLDTTTGINTVTLYYPANVTSGNLFVRSSGR